MSSLSIDDSQDGIVEICEEFKKTGYPIEMLVRIGKRDLSTAVIDGICLSKGDMALVMDADCSHRGSDVPNLILPILHGKADFTIGSRYVDGGRTDDKWTFYRLLNSKIATFLAYPLVNVKDPMSGFFAFSRGILDGCSTLNPCGYKIGLELIVKCRPKKVIEVPIYFRTRFKGRSKMDLTVQIKYIKHLFKLYLFRIKNVEMPDA